ncbi:unnamed protein product [Effrenium voratum]|uniref:adenosine deaminase n=1 Tax=Effrenium voratum TaxID=2562239 RepID=A0AA36JCQ9_9DINO|nr:unnamed protein product [Effrenium voratum]CAJ1462084.1 unnamed protein product [Effrenium voratum]
MSAWVIFLLARAAARVELHVHLDGSIEPAELFAIAKARNLSLPDIGVPGSAADLERFVAKYRSWHRFDAVNEILGGDASAVEMAAAAFVGFQAKSQVRYTEVRYDPVRLSRSSLANASISEEEVVRAVQRGLASGARRHQVEVYQILCAMRGKSPARCRRTADLALQLRSHAMGGVVGLDLAGDETDFPNEAYIECFRYAKHAGLNTTIHSGEFNTTQSGDVHTAVFQMLADRVGHGYAAAQDAGLMQALRDRRVHVEACPNSARLHGAWALKSISAFHQQGLLFGLNTDDPASLFGNTTAAQDESIVLERLNFTTGDVEKAYAAAFDARFGPREAYLFA